MGKPRDVHGHLGVVLNALVVLFNAEDRFLVAPSLGHDLMLEKQKQARWVVAIVVVAVSAPAAVRPVHAPEAGASVVESWRGPSGEPGRVRVAYVALLLVMVIAPTVITVCVGYFRHPACCEGGYEHEKHYLNDSGGDQEVLPAIARRPR